MLAKFILFWTCYTSSFYNIDCKQITGVIVIDSATVITYLYPHEYVTWDIITSNEVRIDDERISSGIYYLKHNDSIHSILTITEKRIEQVVLAPSISHKDRIILKRKSRKLDKKV